MTPSAKNDQGARQRLDFASGCALSVLSLVAILWLIPTYVPGEASRGEVSPSFFPYLAVGIVLICSFAMVVVNRHALSLPSSGQGGRLLLEISGWILTAGIAFALLAYAGFVAAGIFTVIAGVAVSFYRKRWWLAALIAIGLPFLLKWGVWALFSIQLP